VRERVEVIDRDARRRARLLDAREHAVALLVGGGHFRRHEVAVGQQRHVRERPADVDADDGRHRQHLRRRVAARHASAHVSVIPPSLDGDSL